MKQFLVYISVIFLFILSILFVVFLHPTININAWLNLVSGKEVATYGVIHTDIFSYTTVHREWFPSEWLFALMYYYLAQYIPISSIVWIVGMIAGLQVLILFFLLKKIFNTPLILRLLFGILYLSALSLTFVERAQIVSTLFFLLTIFFILLYIKKEKNLLWIILPITILWSNIHPSVFLSPLLLFLFSLFSFVESIFVKSGLWLKKAKILFIFSLVSIPFSMLPPIYTTQFRLLMLFTKEHSVVAKISEWAPVWVSSFSYFIFYCLLIGTIFIFWLVIPFKKQVSKQLLWLLPFIGLVFSPFISERNIIYAIPSIIILLSAFFEKLSLEKKVKKYLIILSCFICLLIFLFGTLVPYIQSTLINHYSPQLISFLKENHVNGNMFNEDKYGDYLSYNLYPEYKTFINGRSDLFLCCELSLQQKLNSPAINADSNDTFKKLLDSIWEKYTISFVITTRGYRSERRIAEVLSSDPKWALIFWDDNAQLFVKKDGKNNKLIEKYGVTAATPYESTPYDKNKIDEAIKEYESMVHISDSALSRNTLGLLFVKRKNVPQAIEEFTKAILLNNEYPPPFLNLAILEMQTGQYKKAKDLFNQVILLDPKNPSPYIYLGEIYAKIDQNVPQAKAIWEQGLQNVSNMQGIQVLNQLLNSY